MPELSSFMDYVGFGKSLKVLKSKIEGFVKRNAEVGRGERWGVLSEK